MKESLWGVFVIMFGVTAVFFVLLFQRIVTTSEHNYHILKEATEGAMYDALDFAEYRAFGIVRIDREKFVENFLRRFAESASLTDQYKIEIYDVHEEPPKVSIQISSIETGNPGNNEHFEFNIVNRIDAILETMYVQP